MGSLADLILISAPVRGLRPLRAARLVTAKVPKPIRETVPPFFRVVRTAPIVASSARAAAALEMSAFLAMCSINSVLFTKIPFDCMHMSGIQVRKSKYCLIGTNFVSKQTHEKKRPSSKQPCSTYMEWRDCNVFSCSVTPFIRNFGALFIKLMQTCEFSACGV